MSGSSYTCCNLHYEGKRIDDTNATTLPFIPAGSKIVLKETGKHKVDLLTDGRPFRIDHDEGREQETRDQYIAKLVVIDDPVKRIDAYPPKVRDAIRLGKVIEGMSKEQVITALGYPRTDVTGTIDKAEWTYWTAEGEEYVLLWSADGTLKEVDGMRKTKLRVVVEE